MHSLVEVDTFDEKARGLEVAIGFRQHCELRRLNQGRLRCAATRGTDILTRESLLWGKIKFCFEDGDKVEDRRRRPFPDEIKSAGSECKRISFAAHRENISSNSGVYTHIQCPIMVVLFPTAANRL